MIESLPNRWNSPRS